MKHILTIMAISLGVAATVPNSYSGGAVAGATEFTQIANLGELLGLNATQMASLAEQIEAKITLANQYVMQGQQYITQMKQLQSMVPDEILSTYRDAVELKNKYTNLKNSVTNLYGDLENAKDSADAVFRDMSLKGLTAEQYVARIQANTNRSRDDVKNMLTNLGNSMKTVQTSYEQVRKFQAQIPASEGIHSSMQTMNAQMNAMLTQSAQTMELSMAALQESTDKKMQDVIKQESQQEVQKNLTNSHNSFVEDFKSQFKITEGQ